MQKTQSGILECLWWQSVPLTTQDSWGRWPRTHTGKRLQLPGICGCFLEELVNSKAMYFRVLRHVLSLLPKFCAQRDTSSPWWCWIQARFCWSSGTIQPTGSGSLFPVQHNKSRPYQLADSSMTPQSCTFWTSPILWACHTHVSAVSRVVCPGSHWLILPGLPSAPVSPVDRRGLLLPTGTDGFYDLICFTSLRFMPHCHTPCSF